MATYSFHRLIMWIVKIDIFLVSMGIFDICFTEMFISPLRFICLLSKLLNLFGCQGNKKGKF